MKKLRELLPKDDRGRILFSASAVGVLLILAALLPLAFRAPAEETGEKLLSAEERTVLFAAYRAEGGTAVSAEKSDSFGAAADAFCSRKWAELTARCISDPELESTAPTGRELLLLRDPDGNELRVCRMWMEAKGDWQNWLDVFFDAESGTVYYLYLSREHLTEGTASDTLPDAKGIAAALAEETGWSLRRFAETPEGDWSAVFSTGTGAACYRIQCTAFDNLIDLKLYCE